MAELVVHGPGNVTLYRGWSPDALPRIEDAIRRWDRQRGRTGRPPAEIRELARAALDVAEATGYSPPETVATELCALLNTYDGGTGRG